MRLPAAFIDILIRQINNSSIKEDIISDAALDHHVDRLARNLVDKFCQVYLQNKSQAVDMEHQRNQYKFRLGICKVAAKKANDELEALKSAYGVKEKAIQGLRVVCDEKDHEIQTLGHTIEVKDQQIQRLKALCDSKDQQIKKVKAQQSIKAFQLRSTADKLVLLHDQLKASKSEINAKDGELQLLHDLNVIIEGDYGVAKYHLKQSQASLKSVIKQLQQSLKEQQVLAGALKRSKKENAFLTKKLIDHRASLHKVNFGVTQLQNVIVTQDMNMRAQAKQYCIEKFKVSAVLADQLKANETLTQKLEQAVWKLRDRCRPKKNVWCNCHDGAKVQGTTLSVTSVIDILTSVT